MATTKKAKTTHTNTTTKKLSPITKITKKLGSKGGATMAAGAVGAVVGGAIGAAAGVILSDEESRTRAIKAATTIRDQAPEVLDEAAIRAQTLQKATKKVTKDMK